mgnify:CR=1 FL=1
MQGKKKSGIWTREPPEWWPSEVSFRDPNNGKPKMKTSELVKVLSSYDNMEENEDGKSQDGLDSGVSGDEGGSVSADVMSGGASGRISRGLSSGVSSGRSNNGISGGNCVFTWWD